MKKLLIVPLLCGLLIYGGCQKNQQLPEQQVDPTEITWDYIPDQRNLNDGDVVYSTIDSYLLQLSGGIATATAVINADLQLVMDNYANAIADNDAMLYDGNTAYQGKHDLNMSMVFIDPSYVSIMLAIYDENDLDTAPRYRGFNYRIDSGTPLTLSDFYGENYQQIIVAQLLAIVTAPDNRDFFYENLEPVLMEQQYLDNWYLQSNSTIACYFDPGLIAPKMAGSITLKLTF